MAIGDSSLILLYSCFVWHAISATLSLLVDGEYYKLIMVHEQSASRVTCSLRDPGGRNRAVSLFCTLDCRLRRPEYALDGIELLMQRACREWFHPVRSFSRPMIRPVNVDLEFLPADRSAGHSHLAVHGGMPQHWTSKS
jgi:hypothetical protein